MKMKPCRVNLSLSACSDHFKEVEDKKISVLVQRLEDEDEVRNQLTDTAVKVPVQQSNLQVAFLEKCNLKQSDNKKNVSSSRLVVNSTSNNTSNRRDTMKPSFPSTLPKCTVRLSKRNNTWSTKRKYVSPSPQQLSVLRTAFTRSRKCTASVRRELALNSGLTLTEDEVRGWYYRQRNKERQLPARKYAKFSSQQLKVLRSAFAQDPNCPASLRRELALNTGLTEIQVIAWYGYQRRKDGVAGVRFSPQQLEWLRAAFAQSPECLPGLERELAANTGLTEKQVRCWYANQRGREGLRLKARFNPEQVKEMVAVFNCTPHPDVFTTTHLSNKIGLAKGQIKSWFRDRRRGLQKRMEEELEEDEEDEEKEEDEDEDEDEEKGGEVEVVEKESVVSGQAPGFAPVLSEDGGVGEEAKAGPGSSKGVSSVWAYTQTEEMEWMPRKRVHFLKWQQQKMRIEKEEEEKKESSAKKLKKKKKKNRISKWPSPVEEEEEKEEEEKEEEEEETGEVEVVKKEVFGQAPGFTQREVLSEDCGVGEEAKAGPGTSKGVSSAPA